MPEPRGPFVTTHAPNGIVCSVDHLASEAGVAMLRAGGTAADAAIAASAVLAVTTQHMCGMGGDLFALVHTGDGAPAVLNASGRAGSGADSERLRAEGNTRMPALGDVRAVPVPGCVDGWVALHERYGRLPIGDVLAPARAYAADGFPVSPLLAALVPLIAELPEAADYTAQGPLRAGDIVRRPGVARALDDIVEQGRDGFYLGEFGEGLLAVGGGEYRRADLERSNADWVDPLGLTLWDHDVWTVPPNSQGYLTLAGGWIAERLPLPDDSDDAFWAHLLVEAARAAAHDRPQVLHEHADGAALIAPDRLAPRLDGIDPRRASGPAGEFRDGGTIYLCAVDRERMGVSLIQSNAAGFGSHVVVPGVRIFLQNRGLGFSLEPGHPAEYGPGRRPPHTLSPALVTRPDGSLHAVIGTMGGDSQPQILLQLLARLLPLREEPAAAIAAPRWDLNGVAGRGFDTWTDPDGVVVRVEGHAPEGWADGLRERGHRVQVIHPFDHAVGHAHVIVEQGGVLAGAADPRARIGAASGY